VFDSRPDHAFLERWRSAVVPPAPSSCTLSAKKKASTAALEAIEALEKAMVADDSEESDRPLSKKELLKLQKQQQHQKLTPAPSGAEQGSKKLSKKELLLAKALEIEALDKLGNDVASEDIKGMSKKELKALKMQQRAAGNSDGVDDGRDHAELKSIDKLHVNGEQWAQSNPDDGTSSGPVDESSQSTLEDKIRKERPPPRIRVMESSQPGYTSLRLENVGIIFRNQEVLKDVTWGVSTGERIGLGKLSSDADFRHILY
jgi:hypothetical protein